MNDPRLIVALEPMGRTQIVVVALSVLLLGIDGFDVLSISFASPGIVDEWGIDRAALGLVLSMELIGMAVGSILLGNVADRFGRRPTILGCLAIITAGMFLATTATSVVNLSLFRLFTGFGIGGVLAAANAVVAEFANARQRNLCVALMAGGFPVGAVIGGTIASSLLTAGDWRVVFEIGAIATGLCLPLTWFLLPESVAYLTQQRPAGALARINKTLRKMGHSEVDSMPAIALEAPRPTLRELFAPGLARTTILLTVAYFAHIMTFYFIIKWIPKIVVDMGYEPSTAGGVLVWANVGGAAGSLLISLSFLSQRVGVRPAVIGALVLSSIMVILFGQGQSDLTQLALVAAATGLCTNAAVVGLYAIFAQSFPAAVRATGTGLVIGVGRGGAALGPIIAGILFQAGSSLASVAWVMASGSLLGGLALLALRGKNGVRV